MGRTAPNLPNLANHTLPGRDDELLRFRGRILGFASSESEEHRHDSSLPAPPPGVRCSACRWFEVRIFTVEVEVAPGCTCDAPNHPDAFREHVPGCGEEPARARYLVLTYGRSEVPGEVNKRRAVWTDSAFEVIEVLTQRDRSDGPFLPAASARALAQAAQWDDGIQDAYVNRAVA